ncbi:MAG TPA: M20/M25/M40 family metallo-hydrolase [Rubrivivax sp.]|nr:M20/M25/M40 family metallo-hydrolase [Rubrivivax sp.]
MNRRSLLGAAALTALPVHAQAATFSSEDLAHAARLRDLGLADDVAWQLVQQLCNEVGARPAGSAGDAKAVAWAQAAMQRLHLSNVRAEPLPLRIWQRGPASARLVAPVSEPLVMAALGNSVAAPEGGIEADVAWYADFAALKSDTSDRARGRVVFIDQKTARTRDGRGYGEAVAARGLGAIEAARRGALALGIRSIGTSGGKDGERVAHTGAMRYELGLPRIPAFAVSVVDADRMAALHGEGKTLRLDLQLQAKSGVEATTHNVIAEVPGGELAQEIVLISAHLDSWDLGVGALDDGAGVAIVTAAAALLRRAGKTPRRTIRVVLFGNEENGFDGALAYGARYKDQVHQLVAESDFGAGRIYALRGRVQPQALPLVETMAATLAPLGVAWPSEDANSATPGPDAAVLMRRHRWPALQLSQDGSAYFDVHHTAHDTLDRIDRATLPQNVACWAACAWLAAQARLSFGPPPL